MQFKVECHDARLGFVIVRQCEPGTFELPEQPRLGEIAIHRRLDQPRKITPEGGPDFMVWGFFPINPSEAARFNVGDIVWLSES